MVKNYISKHKALTNIFHIFYKIKQKVYIFNSKVIKSIFYEKRKNNG